MIDINEIAENIYSTLIGIYGNASLYGEVGDSVADPANARFFYIDSPSICISLSDESGITLSKTGDINFKNISRLHKTLRNIASKAMVNFSVNDFDKSILPREITKQVEIKKEKEMQNVQESALSKMSGSSKTSRQTLEDVKILVKHSSAVDESIRGSRSRNISAIFLERDGERIKFPSTNLSAARAMARHMSNGGQSNDQVGTYIIEKASELKKLREFHRYIKSNGLITEDTDDIVTNVNEAYNTLQNNLKKIAGSNTYKTMCEMLESNNEVPAFKSDHDDAWQHLLSILEDDTLVDDSDIATVYDLFKAKKLDPKFYGDSYSYSDDFGVDWGYDATDVEKDIYTLAGICSDDANMASELKDKFTVKRFDEKYADVLPLVSRIVKEKKTYIGRIQSIVEAGLKLENSPILCDDMMVFESKDAELGYKVKEFSNRIAENADVKSYINNLGNKLSNGAKLSVVESQILQSAFKNAEVIKETNVKINDGDLLECRQIDAFFNKFVHARSF